MAGGLICICVITENGRTMSELVSQTSEEHISCSCTKTFPQNFSKLWQNLNQWWLWLNQFRANRMTNMCLLTGVNQHHAVCWRNEVLIQECVLIMSVQTLIASNVFSGDASYIPVHFYTIFSSLVSFPLSTCLRGSNLPNEQKASSNSWNINTAYGFQWLWTCFYALK